MSTLGIGIIGCGRRGRVVLPLDIEDSPLEAMIESGETGP
jgi:hypothetical protein